MMTDSVQWHKCLPTTQVDSVALLALMQASSLTEVLTKRPHHFSVRLLHLGPVAWQLHEGGFIGLDSTDVLYGREVVLCLDEVPVVWARSVCAAQADHWRTLIDCGTQPLGARLFDGSLPLQRTTFEYAYGHWADCAPEQAVWMRRSAFTWQGQFLYLGEAFLPSLTTFL